MNLQTMSCPHCAAPNPVGGAFCQSCGQALPPSVVSGPRIVGAGGAATATAQQFVRGNLEKQMKKAFTALVIVAIMQTVFGPIQLMLEKSKLEKQNPGMEIQFESWVYIMIFGIAALFWALAIWSRKSPLPAAIVGLVLFVSMHVFEAVVDPTSIGRGWLMKIIVVALLVQAIQGGLKYRQFAAAEDPSR
jgi:uncharacterized membrane protein